MLCFSCSEIIAAAMKRFLNSDAGPSDQLDTVLTELGIISKSMSRYAMILSLECARLSDAITIEWSMPVCHRTAVKRLTDVAAIEPFVSQPDIDTYSFRKSQPAAVPYSHYLQLLPAPIYKLLAALVYCSSAP